MEALRAGPSEATRLAARPEAPPPRRRDTPRGGLLGACRDVAAAIAAAAPRPLTRRRLGAPLGRRVAERRGVPRGLLRGLSTLSREVLTKPTTLRLKTSAQQLES